MPGEPDGFLARVCDAPDDDGPRLIYADWLDEQGDPRGEFIRTQLALARLPEHDRRRAELVRLEQELLACYGAVWTEPIRGLASGPMFHRGFVEEVKVAARQFPAVSEALFATGPIRHLHLLDLGDHIESVLFSHRLGRVTGLTVYGQHLGPQLAGALADSPHLSGLKVLRLGRNRIGDLGVERIASSPTLTLEELDLSENELGEAAGRSLAGSGRLGRLRRLELGGNALGPLGAGSIASSDLLPALEHLGLEGNRIGGYRLATLLNPSSLLRIAALDLTRNRLSASGVDALLGNLESAGVRDLDLTANDLGDVGVARLARSPVVAGLRSLRLAANGVTDAGVATLAESPYLGRLTTLDLANNPIGDPGYRALLGSAYLPQLRRLVYSEVGLSHWMRVELELKFAREAVAV